MTVNTLHKLPTWTINRLQSSFFFNYIFVSWTYFIKQEARFWVKRFTNMKIYKSSCKRVSGKNMSFREEREREEKKKEQLCFRRYNYWNWICGISNILLCKSNYPSEYRNIMELTTPHQKDKTNINSDRD